VPCVFGITFGQRISARTTLEMLPYFSLPTGRQIDPDFRQEGTVEHPLSCYLRRISPAFLEVRRGLMSALAPAARLLTIKMMAAFWRSYGSFVIADLVDQLELPNCDLNPLLAAVGEVEACLQAAAGGKRAPQAQQSDTGSLFQIQDLTRQYRH